MDEVKRIIHQVRKSIADRYDEYNGLGNLNEYEIELMSLLEEQSIFEEINPGYQSNSIILYNSFLRKVIFNELKRKYGKNQFSAKKPIRQEYFSVDDDCILRGMKNTSKDKLYGYLNQELFFSNKYEVVLNALVSLAESGDTKVIAFIEKILDDSRYDEEKENYIIKILNIYFNETKAYNWYIKRKMRIGIMWEELCQEICCMYFPEVLTNHTENSVLSNGGEPDIMWGKGKIKKDGKYIYIPVIADCKKSIYFAAVTSRYVGNGRYIDILNFDDNETTNKYLKYCSEL